MNRSLTIHRTTKGGLSTSSLGLKQKMPGEINHPAIWSQLLGFIKEVKARANASRIVLLGNNR
jgi:hypothetical protein